jgi:hypothetical protein
VKYYSCDVCSRSVSLRRSYCLTLGDAVSLCVGGGWINFSKDWCFCRRCFRLWCDRRFDSLVSSAGLPGGDVSVVMGHVLKRLYRALCFVGRGIEGE